MSERGKTITLRPSPELFAALDKVSGGASKGGRGNHDGRSWFILGVLHKHFDLDPPQKADHSPPPDLSAIDLTKLDLKTQHIVRMYNEGVPIEQIPIELVKQGIPTSRSGQWTKRAIRGILDRVAKKATKRALPASRPAAPPPPRRQKAG